MRTLALALICCLVPAILSADLSTVRSEPDLEKRSEKAMAAADDAFKAAKKAFREGDKAAENAGIAEVRDAVDLAIKSLDDSGKNARRSPKYFKKAEIALRKLIRNLDDFRISKSLDERPPIEELLAHVHEAHDKVLTGIMTKKK